MNRYPNPASAAEAAGSPESIGAGMHRSGGPIGLEPIAASPGRGVELTVLVVTPTDYGAVGPQAA